MTRIKPITRASRREFLILSFAVAGSGALTLAGCGGGKSSSTAGDSTLPQGKAAVRAIAVAAHQSISGGRFYAFAAIKLAAPAGSQFSSRAAGSTAHRSVPDSIVYDDGLQLYKKYTSSGGTVSVSYYKDATGTVVIGIDFANSLNNSGQAVGHDTGRGGDSTRTVRSQSSMISFPKTLPRVSGTFGKPTRSTTKG